MASLEFEQLPYVLNAVMGERLEDADWTAYTEAISRGLAAGRPPRAIVVSDGAAPGIAQRRRLDAATAPAGARLKVAILTGSTFVRGVVNAFAMVQPGYRALTPEDVAGALAHLDLRGSYEAEVRASIAGLRARVRASVQGRLDGSQRL